MVYLASSCNCPDDIVLFESGSNIDREFANPDFDVGSCNVPVAAWVHVSFMCMCIITPFESIYKGVLVCVCLCVDEQSMHEMQKRKITERVLYV